MAAQRIYNTKKKIRPKYDFLSVSRELIKIQNPNEPYSI